MSKSIIAPASRADHGDQQVTGFVIAGSRAGDLLIEITDLCGQTVYFLNFKFNVGCNIVTYSGQIVVCLFDSIKQQIGVFQQCGAGGALGLLNSCQLSKRYLRRH